ncbi:MAG: hypothetical protein KBS86_01025 [Proteobacteria bacterium]|nr:hypothetical protein [Candidatus Enterousia scatequi]
MTWFGGEKPPYEYVAQGVFGLVINFDEGPGHPISDLINKQKQKDERNESEENICGCNLAKRHCCRV